MITSQAIFHESGETKKSEKLRKIRSIGILNTNIVLYSTFF